jgi:hypothetical protein
MTGKSQVDFRIASPTAEVWHHIKKGNSDIGRDLRLESVVCYHLSRDNGSSRLWRSTELIRAMKLVTEK